ncbi:MAG: protein arginine kinase [Peptococcaceae bacterium]|jgi:protein arginine kinase|nr:MAG: protein arginine kinase [Peptococcaceae bacterium]
MSIKETVSSAHSKWMDGFAPESDVVISSRVRAARNLEQFPFPHLLDEEKAAQVINAVREAVAHKEMVDRVGVLELVVLNELSPLERQIMVDKHLISLDLLLESQKKAVVLREDEVISVMVNEEDHLRIQCLQPGLQLDQAGQLVNLVDDLLGKTLDYAFMEKWGYLTTCPTNIGTGMRASVMLHLPGLVLVGQLGGALNTISKLGLTVRGLYGEGTEAAGDLFQVSNQVTLGQSEEEIISNLTSIVRQLLAQERVARQALYREKRELVEDRVWRAYGILKHARVLSSEEALKLFSSLRLGFDLGIVSDISTGLITELMVMIQPAYLIKMSGEDLPAYRRDVYRAELIRKRMGELNNQGV